MNVFLRAQTSYTVLLVKPTKRNPVFTHIFWDMLTSDITLKLQHPTSEVSGAKQKINHEKTPTAICWDWLGAKVEWPKWSADTF